MMKLRKAAKKDLAAVVDLLQTHNLPWQDCNNHLLHFIVAEDEDTVMAAGGLEVYGDVGLVRSIVVSPQQRNLGVGAMIFDRLRREALAQDIQDLYLITETAERYFQARGFLVVERTLVPDAIVRTSQFSELCPASAQVMRLNIG